MQFSVVICTYNRSRILVNVLKTLGEQVLPEDFQLEILVVDNNSTDDTPNVVEGFAQQSGFLVRYVKEKKQGLSYARNRGILEAQGKYIAFTDDDALADECWVREIYNTFEEYHCHCVGGKIHLKCEIEMPLWLQKELWGFLGYFDHGDKVISIDHESNYPFGGNMAFFKDVFKEIGYFNPNLGRRGTISFGGEEAELFGRLFQAGGTAIYQPGALVYHVIQIERMKKRYFRKLHFNEGRIKGQEMMDYDGRIFFGVPLFIFPQFLRSIRDYIYSICTNGLNKSFRTEMIIWYFQGLMLELIKHYYRNTKSIIMN